jgi:hypothetical protein
MKLKNQRISLPDRFFKTGAPEKLYESLAKKYVQDRYPHSSIQ